MKKLLITSIIALSSIISSHAQCDHSQLLEDCKKHLDENHFIPIKEFSVDSDHGESHEHSFSVSKIANYEYYFAGEDWSHHHMKVTLFDSKHKEVATNHSTENEYNHLIKFTPPKDGIYYIKFEFNEGEKFCGSAVLGFNKKEDAK